MQKTNTAEKQTFQPEWTRLKLLHFCQVWSLYSVFVFFRGPCPKTSEVLYVVFLLQESVREVVNEKQENLLQ